MNRLPPGREWSAFPLALVFGSGELVVIGPYVVVPLVIALLWRDPWWLRWIFLGFALFNIGLLIWAQAMTPDSYIFGPGYAKPSAGQDGA